MLFDYVNPHHFILSNYSLNLSFSHNFPHSLSFFDVPLSLFGLSYMHVACDNCSNKDNLAIVILLKDLIFLFWNSLTIYIYPREGEPSRPSLIHGGILIDLILCWQLPLLWLHGAMVMSCPKDSIYNSSWPLWMDDIVAWLQLRTQKSLSLIILKCLNSLQPLQQ